MADSFVDFGTGAADGLTAEQMTGVFDNLTLDYLSTTHLDLTVTKVDGTKTTVANTNLTIATSPALKVTITGGVTLPLISTDLVRIKRTTPVTALQRTFVDGSVLKASDLNTQNKQVLFGVQEQVDGGLGSLPIDTDDKYDAGSRVIKNLGTPLDSMQAVTKEYVDNISLYGGAFGGVDPQHWDFTANSASISGANRVWTLTSPTPASATDNLYLIEIGGVLQGPTSYTITESGGTYTLTVPDGATSIPDGTGVIARNFGVARNVIEQPFINLDDTTVGLIVRNYSASTTADLQQWQNNDGTVLAKVAKDGDATFVDITATGNVAITGDITADAATFGDTVLLKGSGTDGGLKSDDESTYPGKIYFGSGGPRLEYDSGNHLQVQSTKVNVKGPLESDGTITADGGLISGDEMQITGSSTDGIISTSPTTHYGRFYHAVNGPTMRYENGSGTVGSRITLESDNISLSAGYLNLNSNLISNVTDPSAAQDAATKNYVDTQILAEAGTWINLEDGIPADLTNIGSTVFSIPAGYTWQSFSKFEIQVCGVRTHADESPTAVDGNKLQYKSTTQFTSWTDLGTAFQVSAGNENAPNSFSCEFMWTFSNLHASLNVSNDGYRSYFPVQFRGIAAEGNSGDDLIYYDRVDWGRLGDNGDFDGIKIAWDENVTIQKIYFHGLKR